MVRITNKRDLVTVLPPRECYAFEGLWLGMTCVILVLLGFKHTTGERHINVDGVWNTCAGACLIVLQ